MQGLRQTRLRQLPLPLKVLVTAFVVSVAIGYGVSLLQIRTRTGTERGKVASHYRGSASDELQVPQTTATLISVAHVHTFSQPVVIGLMALLLIFTGLSDRAKLFWVLLPFIASAGSNLSPWLIRDYSAGFVSLLFASGAALFLSFLVTAVAVLYETWRREGDV